MVRAVKYFLIKSFFLIFVLAVVIFVTISLIDDYNLPKGCTPMNFSIEKLGERVSCEVLITEDEVYAPMLTFERKDSSLEELTKIQKALGDSYRIKGFGLTERHLSTSVRVIIIKKDGSEENKIVEKIVEPRITSMNAHAVEAELLKQRLEAGVYIIYLESLKEAPLMAEVNTNFRFIKAYRGL